MDILERMPWLAQDAVFKRLASIAEVAAMSKEELAKYDESLRIYRDTVSVMKGQYQEGLEKGIEKGIAKAEEKARQDKLESARIMKSDNMPIELISKYTGLTVEEIEAL